MLILIVNKQSPEFSRYNKHNTIYNWRCLSCFVSHCIALAATTKRNGLRMGTVSIPVSPCMGWKRYSMWSPSVKAAVHVCKWAVKCFRHFLKFQFYREVVFVLFWRNECQNIKRLLTILFVADCKIYHTKACFQFKNYYKETINVTTILLGGIRTHL